MATRRSPTARHRRLIAELNRLREQSGRSRAEVADLIGTTDTTIWRYETGLSRPKPTDVAALLEVYGVTGPDRDELLLMAREARKRGWWHRHRQTLKPGFETYLGLEAEAAVIRGYEAQAVPGLFQTEAYARAIIEATAISGVPGEIDEKIQVRLARQELITRSIEPARFVALLDEAVLRRPVGGEEVMRGQFNRILELGKLPNVDLRVIPFAVGAHAGMDGQFYLLEFPDPEDLDLVYLEQSGSGLVLEDPEDIRRYTQMFGNLMAKALQPDDSIAFISRIAQNGG